MYLLHEYCCEKNIDPNLLVQNRLEAFLSYCKENGHLPADKERLIEEGKRVALDFNYGAQDTNWDKVFEPLLN